MNICVATSRILPIQIESPQCVIIIDVVRSVTSCATALANGAESVQMFAEIEDAKKRADSLKDGDYLLCGERGLYKIEGFDLGNSPLEYSRTVVEGKQILISTTNGPAAFEKYSNSEHVLLATWANISATCEEVKKIAPDSLGIICAGVMGFPSMEDIICAGGILELLGNSGSHLGDGCIIAADAFNKYGNDEAFLKSLHLPEIPYISRIFYSYAIPISQFLIPSE